MRTLATVLAAICLCSTLSACDKCGDPVKFNFPGACADTREQR